MACGAAGRSARQALANGFVESFNGRLRDQCLNREWFHNLRKLGLKSMAGGSLIIVGDRIVLWCT